jgi:hypothetical protein
LREIDRLGPALIFSVDDEQVGTMRYRGWARRGEDEERTVRRNDRVEVSILGKVAKAYVFWLRVLAIRHLRPVKMEVFSCSWRPHPVQTTVGLDGWTECRAARIDTFRQRPGLAPMVPHSVDAPKMTAAAGSDLSVIVPFCQWTAGFKWTVRSEDNVSSMRVEGWLKVGVAAGEARNERHAPLTILLF